ncbi:MAG: phage baseplate assembly protein [Pseudomonadota bacterium]
MSSRVKNLLTMATVIRVEGDDGGQRYQVRGLAGDLFTRVEHHEPYGQSSRPAPAGSDGRGPEVMLVALEKDLLAATPAIDWRYVFATDDLRAGDRIYYTYRDGLAADAPERQRLWFSEDETGRRTATLEVSDGTNAASILLKDDGAVTITATDRVRFETPRVEASSELIDRVDAGNTLTVRGMRGVFDDHTHPEDDAGNTEAPNQKQGSA